jgi:hypothetical protein
MEGSHGSNHSLARFYVAGTLVTLIALVSLAIASGVLLAGGFATAGDSCSGECGTTSAESSILALVVATGGVGLATVALRAILGSHFWLRMLVASMALTVGVAVLTLGSIVFGHMVTGGGAGIFFAPLGLVAIIVYVAVWARVTQTALQS